MDLGAGGLREARMLTSCGFDVCAVDTEPFTREVAPYAGISRFFSTSFDKFPFPKHHFSLVNAMFALHLNPPDTYDAMFARMRRSLRPGGIYCGNFIGPKNENKGNPGEMTFHTAADISRLLGGMDILLFNELDEIAPSFQGFMKRWHTFEVIARA